MLLTQVIELWHGEQRTCHHRCVQHWDWGGRCQFVGKGVGDGSGGQEAAMSGGLGAAAGELRK